MARLPVQVGACLFGPMSEEDQKALNGCDEIIFELVKKRSAGNHKRYFTFIGVAFDMQDNFDNKEIFRKYIQMQAGHFDTVISPKTGESMYWPRSIEWEKLGEDEFKPLFNDVVNAFLKVYQHKLSDDDVNRIVGF